MKGKIFNAQEVQAIIAGNKTQFREVIKPQPIGDKTTLVECPKNTFRWVKFGNPFNIASDLFDMPYQVGQKIFCKESWAVNKHYDNFDPKTCFAAMGGDVKYCVAYASNNEFKVDDWAGKKRSAKSMPQWASRLTPLIKEIGVERLQDISADDCWKEGIPYSPSPECCQNYIAVPDCNGKSTPSCCNNPNLEDPRAAFESIWNAIHKKPEEKFEANPWVWKVEFEVINN